MSVLEKWTWKPETPASVPCGRADFGREVGERRDVVAHQGRRVGELRAGQLHAVARVAAEPNCGFLECKNLFIYACRVLVDIAG